MKEVANGRLFCLKECVLCQICASDQISYNGRNFFTLLIDRLFEEVLIKRLLTI